MKLRRFNDEGISKFKEFIDSHKAGYSQIGINGLLTDVNLATVVQPEVEIDFKMFDTRFDLGEYLYLKLDNSGIPNLLKDVGIWTWLSGLFFDLICPADDNGVRRPRAMEKYVPAVYNHQKYYRHLLAGPYWIYKQHSDKPEITFGLLSGEPHIFGDIPEQLAARQQWVSNAAIVSAATTLYIDENTKIPKLGAGGQKPGSARRLAMILWQFDLTHDLYSFTEVEILGLLPFEFEKFKAI